MSLSTIINDTLGGSEIANSFLLDPASGRKIIRANGGDQIFSLKKIARLSSSQIVLCASNMMLVQSSYGGYSRSVERKFPRLILDSPSFINHTHTHTQTKETVGLATHRIRHRFPPIYSHNIFLSWLSFQLRILHIHRPM